MSAMLQQSHRLEYGMYQSKTFVLRQPQEEHVPTQTAIERKMQICKLLLASEVATHNCALVVNLFHCCLCEFSHLSPHCSVETKMADARCSA
eukprot:747939-Hanusia_phi.AAC.8